MNIRFCVRGQRGATLVVALIMLLLFTLLVSGALTLSTVNLKAVGNTQARNEAIAAANMGIEEVISLSGFTGLTDAQEYMIDFDQDSSTPSYAVTVTVEGCLRATPASVDESILSGVGSGLPNIQGYYTLWELKSVVDDAVSGAEVSVRQGMRKYMAETDAGFSKCK